MAKTVRHLLLILMTIALPLQGLAAVTMDICAGEHHSAYVAANEQSLQHSHHMDVMADMSHHDHQQHGSTDKDSKQKTTCTACYAFSLPVSFTLTAPPLPSTTHPIAPATRFTGFEPEGLERPPRAIPA